MGLCEELGFPNPLHDLRHELALSIVHTSELLSKEADRLLLAFKLTEAQFNVLMLLKYQAGPDGLTQTNLSRFLLVNRANITGLMDRMERDQLITRTSELADRRLKRIRMTSRGINLLEKAEKAYIGRVYETLGHIADVDTLKILQMLEGIRRRLK